MKKNTAPILWLTTVVFFWIISCVKQADDLGNATIETQDSLVFEAPLNISLTFQDYNGRFFLARDRTRSKVFVFDLGGKLLKIIASKGEGPLEYAAVHKFGLAAADEIAILEDKKIVFYSLVASRMARECAFPRDSLTPGPSSSRLYALPNGKIFFPSTIFDNPGQRTFFEKSHTITVFDPSDCSFKNTGGYPETSIYRQAIFPALFDPLIHYNTHTQTLVQWLPLDQSLYFLDINSFSVKQRMPLALDHFGKLYHNPAKNDDMTEMLLFVQRNASIATVATCSKYVLVGYRGVIDHDNVRTSMPDLNQAANERKFFFALFDRSGKKIAADFESSEIRYVIGFNEKDQLLFFKEGDEDKENILYIGNIRVDEQ